MTTRSATRGRNNPDANALWWQALQHLRGLGVRKDFERAAQLFSAASEQYGHDAAQSNLAVMYRCVSDVLSEQNDEG